MLYLHPELLPNWPAAPATYPRPITWGVSWFPTSLTGGTCKATAMFSLRASLFFFFVDHTKLSFHLKVKNCSADLFLLPVPQYPHHIWTTESFTMLLFCPLNQNECICISGFIQPRQESPLETHLPVVSPYCALVAASKYPQWVSFGNCAPAARLYAPTTAGWSIQCTALRRV